MMQECNNPNCQNCQKLQALIIKYEHLINLYKKKQLKSSVSNFSNASNSQMSKIKTDEIFQLKNEKCVNIVTVLIKIMKKRCINLFTRKTEKEISKNQKLALLSIGNKIGRYLKNKAFQKIKKIEESIEQKNENNQKQCKKQKNITQLIIKQNKLLNEEIFQQITKQFLQNTKRVCLFSNSQKQKRLCQITNKKHEAEIQVLKQCLEQFHKRQIKQNQKKKESLQMLAQQINQKNQEIQQLKMLLKQQQNSKQSNGNILINETVQLRRDVDHLQDVKQKLLRDLQASKNQLSQSKTQIRQLSQKNTKLLNINKQISCEIEQLKTKSQFIQKETQTINKLTHSLLTKIKRINKIERQTNSENKAICTQNEVKQELKSQIILMFLSNIHNTQYILLHPQIFNEQQKQVLKRIKEILIEKQTLKVVKQAQNNNKFVRKISKSFDFSEIQGKNEHVDFITSGFDTPNQQSSSITMRMVQMQIDRNKLLSKISQNKQKLFHVRMIILKLLKSLQFQPGNKPDIDGILNVLFDIFQYSEEQRNSIFSKKKKILGILSI